MTDVKVVARPNYCRERQPRLLGCHSELVRAGFKLSPQSFSLALHIRSLVLCRLCVLTGASTHKQTHTHFYTHNSSCIHICSGALWCTQFALAKQAESPTMAQNDIQLGIKTDTTHSIKFASEWSAMKALHIDQLRYNRSFETFFKLVFTAEERAATEEYQEQWARGSPNLAESEIINGWIIRLFPHILSYWKWKWPKFSQCINMSRCDGTYRRVRAWHRREKACKRGCPRMCY